MVHHNTFAAVERFADRQGLGCEIFTYKGRGLIKVVGRFQEAADDTFQAVQLGDGRWINARERGAQWISDDVPGAPESFSYAFAATPEDLLSQRVKAHKSALDCLRSALRAAGHTLEK